MDCKHGTEYDAQILFSLRWRHRLVKTLQGYIEKFLHHLITNNALAGGYSIPNELGCPPRFCYGILIEGINKNVGIEKELTVHSFRPG